MTHYYICKIRQAFVQFDKSLYFFSFLKFPLNTANALIFKAKSIVLLYCFRAFYTPLIHNLPANCIINFIFKIIFLKRLTVFKNYAIVVPVVVHFF